MKHLNILIISMFISITATANNSTIAQYKEQATMLHQQLLNKNAKELEKNAKNLVDISKTIVIKSIRALPQCQTYLTALLNVADDIASLSIEEIESGYHADGKLPPLTDGSCYHTKDLLVHPATVQAMAKTQINTKEEWKQAAHEIEEVLEHLAAVEAVLTSNTH